MSFSHEISGIRFGKANLIVPNKSNDDIITLVYKEHINKYKENDFIELQGNVRSFSKQLGEGKNKVSIYVFTYFDIPKFEDGYESDNIVQIDGRICKKDGLRTHTNEDKSLSLILANNIFLEHKNSKINNYIPIICWNNLAEMIDKYNIGTKIVVSGRLHSRTYKKYEGEELVIKTAHEIVADKIEVVE